MNATRLARRQWLVHIGATLAALSTAGLAQAQTSKPAAKLGEPVEIKWDDLVPKGWDPMKGLKDKGIANPNSLIDGDPKAQEALRQMREAWDNAPTEPALDNSRIKIPGYLVPLEEDKSGLSEFLLVPYFGACVHTPPPPANQIVLVQLAKPAAGFRSMDTVWVSGTLKAKRSDSPMGASGYRLEGALVERYKATPK